MPQNKTGYIQEIFNEHYAFFELRGVDWAAARLTNRPQVGTRDLFDIFKDMLGPLGIRMYG